MYNGEQSDYVVLLQVDSTMVKSLDSNLFLGDEIRDVYSEIMKTVPTDHLNCEQVTPDSYTKHLHCEWVTPRLFAIDFRSVNRLNIQLFAAVTLRFKN